MLPRHVPAMLAQDGFRPAHPAARGAATEVEYAGLQVRVLSAAKARAYQPGEGEIAISIRGPREPAVQLSPRFDAVLPLVFDDTSMYATPHMGAGDAVATMSAAQADTVVVFVRAHPDATTLLIHCTAGVSRSRSLAAAVCVSLGLPYEFTVLNEDVFRAVSRAFAMVMDCARPSDVPRN